MLGVINMFAFIIIIGSAVAARTMYGPFTASVDYAYCVMREIMNKIMGNSNAEMGAQQQIGGKYHMMDVIGQPYENPSTWPRWSIMKTAPRPLLSPERRY